MNQFFKTKPAITTNPPAPKLGVIFVGGRRPGFDMEWGRRMEERVRGWLRMTPFAISEPPEKADALVLLQTTMADGRLAPTDLGTPGACFSPRTDLPFWRII